MKIFIPKPIPEVGIRLLKEAGHSVTIYDGQDRLTPQAMISACLGHDALLGAGFYKLDAAFLEACSHLKVIALFSVGYDNIDVATATRLGIPVGNTPGVLSNATADAAFLLMLAVSRKAFYLHNTIAGGEWGFSDTIGLGFELNGKTLGVFGMGSIGLLLAQKCAGAYGMKVLYNNRHRNEDAERKSGAVWVPFDDLLARSDVLSLHASLTPETRGLFDQKAFSRMKPSSIFINTARGGMHNEADLTEALRTGAIWGAGLDVTNPEPMDKNNPLLFMPNVAVLPHVGSATEEARNGMATLAAQNIIAALGGQRLPHAVNPEVYG
jgi:glyoxylate reductase